MGSWGDDDLINLKLVDREKSWASIDTAFAEQGNGGISAASIDEHKEVKYDLSKLNYRTQIDGYVAPVDGMIQYRITNPDLAGKYSEIIVASNPFMEDKNLSIELSKDWVVIVDGVATDIEGIAGYDYSVNKIATVKKHTMMIFARKPLSSDPQVVAYENAKNLINETLPLVSKTTSHKELEDKINKINANITQLTDTTQSEELKTLAKPIQDKYDQLKTAYDNRIKAVVTLKYLPKSGDATDWGLHLWSSAIDNVFEGKEKQLKQWDKPILFEKNKDADGYYVINIGLLNLNPADPIEFIIHKGDDKSFPENIPLPTITGDKTLYVVQDSKTVFDSKPTQAQIDAIWAPKAVVSTVTIKFKPTDGDINGWGIHVWDKTMVDLPGMNDWANPLPFSTATDANGYYEFELPLYDGSKQLEFIIHKADIKLGNGSLHLPVTASDTTYWVNGQQTTDGGYFFNSMSEADKILNDIAHLNTQVELPTVDVADKNRLASSVTKEEIVLSKNGLEDAVTFKISDPIVQKDNVSIKVTIEYKYESQRKSKEYIIKGFKTQSQLDLDKLTTEIEKPTVTVVEENKNQLFSTVKEDQIVFTPNNIDADISHKIVSKVKGPSETELKVTIEYSLNEQKLTKEYTIDGFKTQAQLDLVLLNTEADKPTVSVEEKNKNQTFSTVKDEQIVIAKNAMNESVTYKITSKVQGATETQLKVTITYTLNEQSVTREYVIDGFKTQAQLDLIKLNTEIQKISVNVSDENKNQSFSTVSDGQIIITKNDLDPNVTYAIIAKTQGVDEATLKVILEFSFNGQKVTKNYEITGFKTQAEIDSLIQAYIDANKTGYTLPEAVSTKYASDVNASVTEPTYADDGIILASNITTNIQYEFNDTTGTQKATITIKYSGKYETVVTLEKTGYKTTSATLAQIANETSEAQKSRDDKEVRSVYYTKVDKLVATIKTLPESMVESEMAKIKSLTDFKELYKKYKNHIVMKFKPKDPSQIDKFGVHVWTDGNGQDIILPDDKNVDYANSRKFSSTPDADGFYSLIVRSKGLGTFKFIIHKNENGNDIKNGTEQNGVKVPKFVSLEPKNAESKTLWYIESYTPAGDENYYSLPAEDINTNFVDYYVANAINFLEDTKTTGASATTYFQGLAEQFNLMSDANKATHRELFNETLLKFALKFKNDFLYNGNKVAAIKFKPNNDDMLNWKIYVFATGYNDTNIGNLIDIPLPAGYGYANSLSFGSTKDENGYYTLVLPLKSNTNEIKFIIHRDNNGTDVKNGNNNDKAIQKDLSENRAFYVNDGDADVKWTLV